MTIFQVNNHKMTFFYLSPFAERIHHRTIQLIKYIHKYETKVTLIFKNKYKH